MFARISVALALAAILVAGMVSGGAFAKAVVLEGSDVITTPGEDRSTATTVWFQGFLADDTTGDPINATYNIVARIYSAAGGGSLLWGPETHPSVTITEGWFNIELGSVSPPLPSFANPPYYLSLQVNGEYLTPRLKLASVPSAIQAATSDLLPFSGTYTGGSTDAFHLGNATATAGDALQVERSNGLSGAFAVYASNNAPGSAVFRGFQDNSSSSDAANVLRADITNIGNDSPVVDAWTAGAGPAYLGVTNGAYGLEIYTDASDASADSAAHVVHAVYNGGSRDANNIAVYGEALDDEWGIGGEFHGDGAGVVGVAEAPSGGSLASVGVLAAATSANAGTNVGVWGQASLGAQNYAGLFTGDVDISGTLTKSAGTFKIDHPLDPANKYLSHSFVESPDMKNIYDGVVVLDASGRAVVDLPDWFEALNQDFRYQLTCVGAFAPVYVADEIAGNRFTIAGGEPGMRVSWQVTGIRHDPYAQAHRTPVEEVKPPREQGTYRNPELYGAPESAGFTYDARMAQLKSHTSVRSHAPERRTAPEGLDPAQQ